MCRNVAGLNSQPRLHQVLSMSRPYDIICLQETKISQNQAPFIRAKWGGDSVFISSLGTASRGVVTLFHQRTSPTHLYVHCDPLGQFIINVAIIKDELYVVVNVYGNPDTDAAALTTMSSIHDQLQHIHQNFQVQHCVMGGDFNFVLQPSDTYSTSSKPRAEDMCRSIISAFDLFDVAALNSNNPRHTYFRHRREMTSARYDRIYTTPSLLPGISFKILRRTSDHAPIEICTAKNGDSKRWRMSDFLLSNVVFLEGLHNTVREALQGYSNLPLSQPLHLIQSNIDLNVHSSSTIFENLIRKVRQYCTKETLRTGRIRKAAESAAIDKLVLARNNLNSAGLVTDQLTADYEEAQLQLHAVMNKKSQNASTSNLINHSTMGERMSRYHFLRSKRGRPSREIPKLILQTDNGPTILTGSQIPLHMTEKYSKIIQKDPIAGSMTIEEFLGPDLVNSLRKCPEIDHPYLTSPVLEIEIHNAIKDMKAESSPGALGISNLLLKELAPFITTILSDLGNRLFFDEIMPDFPAFLFHRLVVFILKAGKPTTDEDSYRGLSLLENFFKIFDKILSTRMERPLKHIQHHHQFGFTAQKGILEASRSVLDVIRVANLEGLPLIVLSTDFYKAFDSISIEHIANALNIYEFPPAFSRAYSRFSQHGTVQYEVNNSLSDDHRIEAGVGQGSPKSAGAYNLAASPLNHYLAHSEDVPRLEIDNIDIEPIYFADDLLNLLKGDKIEEIIAMLKKIEEFRKVSGLRLNLKKCEFLAINCSQIDIDRLVNSTGMKHTTVLKHLGLHISSDGSLSHQDNIEPLRQIMMKTSESYNTALSTPLGRSIWAKYLISSKYIHRLQNAVFPEEQLVGLREAALLLTWTRARIHDDSNSIRTHIANNRVSQPPQFGGLGLPDPCIQTLAIRYTWARKFSKLDNRLVWVRLLEAQLRRLNRPPISCHMMLGSRDWDDTAISLSDITPFWSHVFSSISRIIQLSHKFDRTWSSIPILGSELSPETDLNIGSLSAKNPAALRLVQAGLYTAGQLFKVNEVGIILPRQPKGFPEIEAEFQINIPILIRNSILSFTGHIRRCFNILMNTDQVIFENKSTIQSLVSKYPAGCSQATNLLLRAEREQWEWGPFPRSYSTYLNENMIQISPSQFSASFIRTRASLLPPAVQWSSISILLRTFWTRVKEARTLRNQFRNPPFDSSCSNCHGPPERTKHLIYDCQIAQRFWQVMINAFNDILTISNPDHDPIIVSSDLILFNHPPPGTNQLHARDLTDTIMLAKHVLVKLKYRHNPERLPTERLLIATVVLDIEKIIRVRALIGQPINMLAEINQTFKSIVGF